MGFMDLIKGFLLSFLPNDWGVNNFIIMWIMLALIVWMILLAVKKDAKAEKLSSLMWSFGWLGLLNAMVYAYYMSGNPELQESEKLLVLLGYSFAGVTPVLFAVLGDLVVKVIGVFSKPAA